MYFVLELRRKRKTNQLLFYNIPPKLLFLFFISHHLNRIIIIDMCMQFIIVAFYNELITNKVL